MAKSTCRILLQNCDRMTPPEYFRYFPGMTLIKHMGRALDCLLVNI